MEHSSISLETLANEIKMVYRSDISNAEKFIENYIEKILREYVPEERLSYLEELAQHFRKAKPCTTTITEFESKDFLHFLSLLFGEKISINDFSSTELCEKLTHSFNTIFDTLNRIIIVIHSTLLGENLELQTIRQIIGSNLEDESKTDSLQNYLDQIQKAFLVAHQSFQQAAQNTMAEVLAKLDPDYIAKTVDKGLKFGPLRKAELFETYRENFQSCKDWFESGRFTEKLLKDFEKICQKLYKKE